jgi:hypothetical protein
MTAPQVGDTTSRRGLLLGLTLGVPLIAYGVRGAVVDGARTHPAELARWVVGAAVVNDLVLMPAVFGAGWAARRLVPERLWPAVRAGMLTTGVLALVAWPFVRGYGRDEANPSLLPRDYGGGLLRAVVAVWLVVMSWTVATTLTSWLRRRARGAERAAPAGPRPGRPP